MEIVVSLRLLRRPRRTLTCRILLNQRRTRQPMLSLPGRPTILRSTIRLLWPRPRKMISQPTLLISKLLLLLLVRPMIPVCPLMVLMCQKSRLRLMQR